MFTIFSVHSRRVKKSAVLKIRITVEPHFFIVCIPFSDGFEPSGWALLAKPQANVVIPKSQPLPKYLWEKTSKSAKYRLPLR